LSTAELTKADGLKRLQLTLKFEALAKNDDFSLHQCRKSILSKYAQASKFVKSKNKIDFSVNSDMTELLALSIFNKKDVTIPAWEHKLFLPKMSFLFKRKKIPSFQSLCPGSPKLRGQSHTSTSTRHFATGLRTS
jgi:hypothetical protein